MHVMGRQLAAHWFSRVRQHGFGGCASSRFGPFISVNAQTASDKVRPQLPAVNAPLLLRLDSTPSGGVRASRLLLVYAS